MEIRSAQKLYPSGIRMLQIFYLVGALFYAFSIVTFYNYIQISLFGRPVGQLWSNVINLLLSVIPFYFYIDLHGPNRRVLYSMYIYHVIFIVNAVVSIFKLFNENFFMAPIMQIVEKTDYFSSGIEPGAISAKVALHLLSILVGIIIISYLLRKKNFFAA